TARRPPGRARECAARARVRGPWPPPRPAAAPAARPRRAVTSLSAPEQEAQAYQRGSARRPQFPGRNAANGMTPRIARGSLEKQGVDPGAIASLLQHPIDSALLVLDAEGHPIAANPAAQAMALPDATARYATLLQDLRASLAAGERQAVACSVPGADRRLDGWLRGVRGEDGEPIAYTLSIPDPDGASRWQVALDSAGHGLWDWDIGANRIFRSETWRAMLGFTVEDAPDSSLESALAMVHPDDVERVRRTLREHLDGRTDAYACEHRVRHCNGSWRWIRDSGRVVAWSADGRPLRMIGTHTQVDEQKQLEERLRGQQTLLEEIQRLAGITSWSWTPDADTGWWPRELYRVLGHPPRDRDSARAWLRRLPCD